jgi:hypothetical protein
MPYKWQTRKKKLPRDKDRRVKFDAEDIKLVHTIYKVEGTIRGTARVFSRYKPISRRYVSFILFPEQLARANAQHKERRKDGRYYPGKERWSKIMREHRQYKQSVMIKKYGTHTTAHP